MAVELDTGRVVYSRSVGTSLAPASTEKLAVSYAVLATLGPTYRIPTRVYADGRADGATWRGNLVLKGYGDPTLSRAGLRRLALKVRAAGIRRVAGAVVGDESYFDSRRTASGWKSYFYRNESAPISALTVDGGRARGIVVRNPALIAAALFKHALASVGVSVARAPVLGRTTGTTELAATVSPPLFRILRLVNRDSDNFTAEVLLKHLGAVEAGRGTTAAGAAVVRRVLEEAGVPLAGVRIVDGSGLSRLDRLTAAALVGILAAAWSDAFLRPTFVSSLAISGASGTLRHRLRTARVRGKVFAKTGTTSLSSALAGYVGRYAFAIVHNGPPLSSWWCRYAQDRFVSVLARYG